jgi:hypothetical protein
MKFRTSANDSFDKEFTNGVDLALLAKDLYKKRNLKPSKSDFRKPFKTGEKFKVTPRGVLMTRKISRVRKRRMLKALYA